MRKIQFASTCHKVNRTNTSHDQENYFVEFCWMGEGKAWGPTASADAAPSSPISKTAFSCGLFVLQPGKLNKRTAGCQTQYSMCAYKLRSFIYCVGDVVLTCVVFALSFSFMFGTDQKTRHCMSYPGLSSWSRMAGMVSGSDNRKVLSTSSNNLYVAPERRRSTLLGFFSRSCKRLWWQWLGCGMIGETHALWHLQHVFDFSSLGPSSFAAIAQVCGPGHPKLWVQLIAGTMGAHWLGVKHETFASRS